MKLSVFPIFLLLLFGSAVAQEKPNVLWIITDDQRADALSCYNQAVFGQNNSPLGYVESPNIDAFASEGVLFTKAYCNSPGCSPSRGSMHTGKYPFRSGIYGFEQTHQNATHCDPTVPEVMRNQGYKTAHFGKSGVYIFEWGPGLTWNDPGLYDFKMDMKNNLQKHGFTDFYNNTIWGSGGKVGVQEEWHYPNGTIERFFTEVTSAEISTEDLKKKNEIETKHEVLRSYTRENQMLIFAGESPQPGPKTLDGRITEAFKNYLNNPDKNYTTLDGQLVEGPKTSQPQFIHLGFHFPHTPVLPPKSFRDRFKNKTYVIPDFNEEELTKLPSRLVTLYNKMKISDMSYEEKQETIRNYYAFCAFGDSLVGEAVRSFKEYSDAHGQEYLIVLACGDHGWHLGEQGYSAKFGPYDMSNHTGVIVVSSDKTKFPENTVCNDFVEYVDFAPTFFSAAGLDINSNEFEFLDGYNLAEVVEGTKPPRDYALGCMNHVIGDRSYIRSKDFAFSMLTRKGWGKPKESDILADVKWPLATTRANAEMALYDLRVDAGEQTNVAYDEKYVALADWFRNKLGNIVLGDGRVECDWTKENVWQESNFAAGADDKKLDIPEHLIPALEDSRIPLEEFSFSTEKVTIPLGSQLYLNPKFRPFDASNKKLIWHSSDERILLVENGIIYGKATGEIQLKVSSDENPAISRVVTITVVEGQLPTGLNQINNKVPEFRIYPNPVRQTLYIEGLDKYKNASLKLFSLSGKMVLSKPLTGDVSREMINVSELAPGMYLVLLENYPNAKEKIIKN